MDKSMFEIAKEIMESADAPIAIEDLLDAVMKEAGIDNDPAKRAQLYIDITTSADFVYCGDNDLWDLKERQSLDLWDKSFYEAEGATEDDDDDLTMDDYNYVEDEIDDDDDDEDSSSDDDDDEDEEDDDTEVYDVDAELEDEDDDDDENSWDDDDEEKYNDMMDDYEDLYDDK